MHITHKNDKQRYYIQVTGKRGNCYVTPIEYGKHGRPHKHIDYDDCLVNRKHVKWWIRNELWSMRIGYTLHLCKYIKHEDGTHTKSIIRKII